MEHSAATDVDDRIQYRCRSPPEAASFHVDRRRDLHHSYDVATSCCEVNREMLIIKTPRPFTMHRDYQYKEVTKLGIGHIHSYYSGHIDKHYLLHPGFLSETAVVIV